MVRARAQSRSAYKQPALHVKAARKCAPHFTLRELEEEEELRKKAARLRRMRALRKPKAFKQMARCFICLKTFSIRGSSNFRETHSPYYFTIDARVGARSHFCSKECMDEAKSTMCVYLTSHGSCHLIPRSEALHSNLFQRVDDNYEYYVARSSLGPYTDDKDKDDAKAAKRFFDDILTGDEDAGPLTRGADALFVTNAKVSPGSEVVKKVLEEDSTRKRRSTRGANKGALQNEIGDMIGDAQEALKRANMANIREAVWKNTKFCKLEVADGKITATFRDPMASKRSKPHVEVVDLMNKAVRDNPPSDNPTIFWNFAVRHGPWKDQVSIP